MGPDGLGVEYSSYSRDPAPKQVSLKNTFNQGAGTAGQAESVPKSLMRVVSGDERFLINHSKMGLPNSYTNTTGNRETLLVISALGSGGLGTAQAACVGLHSVNSSGDFTSEQRSQKSGAAYGVKLVNSSF